MKEIIQGVKKMESFLKEIDFKNIQFIKECKYYVDNDEIIMEILFEVRSIESSLPGRYLGDIRLKFFGVESVKIMIDNGLPSFIAGFIIDDLSKNQLDKVNYRVMDYENGVIDFYCERIEIVE